jgi:hypothetical protein
MSACLSLAVGFCVNLRAYLQPVAAHVHDEHLGVPMARTLRKVSTSTPPEAVKFARHEKVWKPFRWTFLPDTAV